MPISVEQKKKITQTINVFETGTKDGKYDSISIYSDGPIIDGKRIKQITYGRSQTTEYGVLKILVQLYITNNGVFANELIPYVAKIGKQPSLCKDIFFKNALKNAGKLDPIMRATQDIFFNQLYYQPAFGWFATMKFTQPLSLLVIYDSYIHSGSILPLLRNKFSESVPKNGGDEKTWIKEYVAARDEWLRFHSNKILRNTVCRTECFQDAINKNNWDLSKKINANGTAV